MASIGIFIVCMFGHAARADGPAAPDDGDIVAVVGRHLIRLEDLERQWRGLDPAGFARTQQQLREGRKRALDALIDDLVLQDEADRQRVTVEELLRPASPPAAPPTPAQVREIYDGSPAPAQGVSMETAAPLIVDYLERQRSAKARREFTEALKKSAFIDVRIPVQPWRERVEVAPTDPAIGPSYARIELVEFSDFECPYCRRAVPVLKQILSRYPDQVRLVWKDFPLPMHASARPAAEAAQCANEQGQFWAYHDVLFRNQELLKTDDLRKHAADMGLDVGSFNECFESGRYRKQVDSRIQEGKRHGVSATPTVFINGRMVMGAMPFDVYDQIIREELSATGRRGARR
jgi:protein-disulfide isomerase